MIRLGHVVEGTLSEHWSEREKKKEREEEEPTPMASPAPIRVSTAKMIINAIIAMEEGARGYSCSVYIQ